MSAKAARTKPLSKREDACDSCGSPLLVCPSTFRYFIRCCPGCTHRTTIDEEREELLRTLARQRAKFANYRKDT